MAFPRSRSLRLALILSVGFAHEAAARTPQASVALPAAKVTADPGWLYRGSDIPPDKAWLFGELPNGLRYAVRRNGVPPGQVSIRVAIDAGSLNERDAERGFAHFNEHLSFRGSRYVPDGEAKRLWQRLGATFGSDTNATTTPTQTIYKIDLPNATPAGLDESVKILSGMMAAPSITQGEVDAERRTVLAEMREGIGPGQRVGDATRALLFFGQPLGKAAPIGTTAELDAATPATLRAFHDRWYRPEHTVIVIAGDGDPRAFEALVRKYFGDWKGVGATPPAPDFGAPDAHAPRAKVMVEPGSAILLSAAVLRPWRQVADTIEYNRGNLVRSVAARVINRRLETRARAGGSFLSASIDTQKLSRSVDGTFIQIVPLGSNWEAALRDVRGVIADALARPASQSEIDREANEFAAAMNVAVETDVNDTGPTLADNLVEAVNIRETVASPEVARDVFSHLQSRLNPANILTATREIMAGTPMRAIVTLPSSEPRAEARLLNALTAPVGKLATAATRAVSFDLLPKFGPPGTLTTTRPIPELQMTLGHFANGVRIVLYPRPAEAGRTFVQVRFGGGMRALPAGRPSVAFAAEGALIASGIGDFGQQDLDQLTSARKINLDFDIDDDAFVFKATTRPADLADQLKLMAAKLAFPRWDAGPVLRTKAAMLLGYDGYRRTPSGVLGREMQGALHDNDPRWAAPDRAQIEALTPEKFKALWAPLLASGQIELSIYGDFDPAAAMTAAAATFGALPRRPALVLDPAALTTRSVRANTSPAVRYHTGPADQAAALIAWPTAGGLDDPAENHRLDVLAQVFNDRLFDKLREGEGASYSPSVASQWPTGFAQGGNIVAYTQVQPGGVDRFFALANGIAADLASKPVTDDELKRAVGPMRQLIERASTGSSFWLSQLGGVSYDPRKATALATLPRDLATVTAADLMVSAKRWLKPDTSYKLVVLPMKK